MNCVQGSSATAGLCRDRRSHVASRERLLELVVALFEWLPYLNYRGCQARSYVELVRLRPLICLPPSTPVSRGAPAGSIAWESRQADED